MRPRIAIVAAMARELRPLVQDWKLERSTGGVTLYSSEAAVAAFAGIGANRATLATAAALELGPISLLISAGWAGGLHAGMAGGSVHRVRKVIDAGTGEAYESGGTTGATLLTAKAVVSLDGKRRLREQYLGDLVDMEAATVARLGVSRKLPFMAIKAVSDEFDFDLPGMERFVTGDGKFREAAFGMYLAVRPQLWKAAGQMGRTSALAADALCRELESAIATCGVSG